MQANSASKNFVLLSKVAKEKKYAQEYLGLLARRGDLGSVRLGKRWYTTKEWFEEFFSDVDKRKEEIKTQMAKKAVVQQVAKAKTREDKIEIGAKAAEAGVSGSSVGIEIVKSLAEEKKEQFILPVKEKEVSVNVIGKISSPVAYAEKSFTAAGKLSQGFDIRRPREQLRNTGINFSASISAPKIQKKLVFLENRERESARKGRHYFSAHHIREQRELETNGYNFSAGNILKERDSSFKFFPKPSLQRSVRSPSFLGVPGKEKEEPSQGFEFFSFGRKFAFATALVLLLAVLSEGTYLHKKDTANFMSLGGGTVAGAEDTKLAGISSFNDATSSYFESRRGQTKENISLSRVILEATLEKNPQ